MICAAPAVGVHRAPDAASEQMDQLLFGEPFEVLEEEANGWVFGRVHKAFDRASHRLPKSIAAQFPPANRIVAPSAPLVPPTRNRAARSIRMTGILAEGRSSRNLAFTASQALHCYWAG